MTSQLYLILKRGLYYRPDGAGYTGLKSEAGRFALHLTMTGDTISQWPDMDPAHFILEADAPDFAPGYQPEDRLCDLTIERDRLAAELSEVKRQRQSAWEALATQEEEIARLQAEVKQWRGVAALYGGTLATERALADRFLSDLGEALSMEDDHWARVTHLVYAHRAARGRP